MEKCRVVVEWSVWRVMGKRGKWAYLSHLVWVGTNYSLKEGQMCEK